MEFYGFVHKDNILPTRFPIGLEELIKKFSAEDVRAFYERNYRYVYEDVNVCVHVRIYLYVHME